MPFMPTLIELTAKIGTSHAFKAVMTQEQIFQDMYYIDTSNLLFRSFMHLTFYNFKGGTKHGNIIRINSTGIGSTFNQERNVS